MIQIERWTCPKCDSYIEEKHCKSPTCNWFICRGCSDGKSILVIDRHKRCFLFTAK